MTEQESVDKREGVSATACASTPFSLLEPANGETLRELEFEAALERVAAHAVSSLGAVSVRSRVPSRSPEWIRSELAAVAELQRLLERGDDFRPEPVQDVASIVETLGTPGSALEPSGLNAVRAALGSMRVVRSGLERVARDAPRVAGLMVDIPPSALERVISVALGPDGVVLDEASPELARARRRLRETRARLVAFLEKLLERLGPDGQGEVTLRGGRYVVPVRRDARAHVRGIVHGESGSGATLFVEPSEAVELGNDLNGWESAETRAVLAVLRGLTEQLRPHRTALAQGLEMCVRVDDLYARARYAIETRGHAPKMDEMPARLSIVAGVHPLLLAESDQPVPFGLELSHGEYTLLVSGPNAGGKTVLLKAVGLLCALAQSGVIPPVGPGTRLPIFRHFFADIGDHQSIAASLSTFSAHLAALRRILMEADSGALVLLDELGGGTDPLEGAALAGAALLSLNERKSITIATTHLSQLKELAAQTDGVVNASLSFDLETLAPTYRFIKHQPGRSYGLAIARRLGLPGEVLARAEALQPETARSLDAMLADVQRREEALATREEDQARSAALHAEERAEVVWERQMLEERERFLAEREREIEREGRQRARLFLLEARRRVEQALGVARAAVTEATAREARRLVEEGVRGEAEALKELKRHAKMKGWRVKGSGERGAVTDGDSSLSGPEGRARETDSLTSGPAPRSPLPYLSTEIDHASTEIDLRGITADEAEHAVVSAIDEAIVADIASLRIIHGKGTGALRSRVGQVLRADRRVVAFRLAPPEQGGSGVTIVEFVT